MSKTMIILLISGAALLVASSIARAKHRHYPMNTGRTLPIDNSAASLRSSWSLILNMPGA